MRSIFFLTIIVLLVVSKGSFAQDTSNCKVFRSIYEYRDNDTLNDFYFEVTEDHNADVSLVGGSAFDIYFPDRKVAKKFRKQYVWGAIKDSAFFVNNRRFSTNPGFNFVEYHGYRYFLMLGTVSKYEIDEIIYNNYYHGGSIIVGAITGAVVGMINEMPMEMGIAYDVIGNKFFYLNEAGVNELLKDKPVELNEYELLPDKKDYHAVFRIIEKIDREEYRMNR
jgi:hypothetical protein